MNERTILPRRTPEVIHGLMAVALGAEKADLVIENARIVNVFTGEIHENHGVAVKGPWIARVSQDVSDTVGPETQVIDAAGQTLIPGLIDGHTHLAVMYAPATFVPFAVASGVTTVVSETLEFYPVSGLAGVVDFLESLKDQPIRFFSTATAMVSINKDARGIDPGHLKTLLAREDVIGLGESYWQAVLQDPEGYLPAMSETLLSGKVLEGHTAGASEKKLAAYAATGVTSCHEPINADQALSRMRMGIHVLAREGSIRRDIDALVKIKEMGVDLRRFALSSDTVSAQDLLAGKYMDFTVQKAIDHGFPAVSAIQAATLNMAEHFRLDNVLGAIAPGRLADMVLIPDLTRICPQTVLCNGKILLENGQCRCAGRLHDFSDASRHTVSFPRDFEPSDFRVAAPGGTSVRRVRVMEMVTDLVTQEAHLDLTVINGAVTADPGHDLLKVAALDRAVHPGKIFTGLIKGFGLTSGALASSATWDGPDMCVVGCTDADMACAVNRLRAIQGGVVLCDQGRVVAEIGLPIFGLICEAPLATIVRQFEALVAAGAERGVSFPDPFLSLNALTGAAIPYLRICSEGLVNLKDGHTLGLFL